ncbi:MAG TPA: GerMN domain-containing protein [Acidimicrobiales bacterium]|nr:GerMN domain-containing protein [Acidimicrobiales bacterium]
MKRLRALTLLVLGALALSGCTFVAPNAAPVRISKLSDPYGLFNQTIPGTNNARVRFITQPVYIVDATKHLAPSSRIVPSPPTLATVIGQLLLGPTAIETSAGYSSALPTNLVLISATVRNQIGYFNFATPLSSLSRAQQLLAVGQLVLTAFDVGATRGVVIKVAGVTQRLLVPSGARTTLVSENDVRSLLN